MKVFGIFEEFPFLTLSNKFEKCLCIRFVCLSVRLSVHALTVVNILSNVFKFMYVIHIRNSMDYIKNDMHKAKGSFTETHKSFPIYFDIWEGSFWNLLQHIYITLNIFHSVVQKHVSYTGSHKRFLIHYGLYMETVVYTF